MNGDTRTCAPQGGWDVRGLCGAGVFALIVGLVAGLVLYLPWDTIWNSRLNSWAAEHPELRIQWQNVDRAGALGFRVNGLTVEGPGWPVSVRLQWADVRLGISPRAVVRVDSGGREARIVYMDSGSFDAQGLVNLSCLGRKDIRGIVDLRAQGRLGPGYALERGLLDLNGRALALPEGVLLGDAALALEYDSGALRIRSFSMHDPVQVRAEGTASVQPGAVLRSPYAVSGEIIRGRDAIPFQAQGELRDFLGGAALPE